MTEQTVGRGVWIPSALFVGVSAVWEAVSRAELVSPVLISSPSRIARASRVLLSDPVALGDAAFSAQVFVASVVVALVAGTGLGLTMGTSRVVHQVLNPFIVVTNALPKIVLMPLIVLWLGIGLSSNLFLGALMASFPVVMSTMGGVRALERDFLTLGRAFGASRAMRLRTIVLPGVAPYLTSGLRVGINYAMVGVLIAEFFASSKGIGHRMVLYMSNFEIDLFFACLVLVAVVALACNAALQRIEARLQAWRPSAVQEVAGL